MLADNLSLYVQRNASTNSLSQPLARYDVSFKGPRSGGYAHPIFGIKPVPQ
jgi:hypothetical protein